MKLPPHVMACIEFRAYCLQRSRSVFFHDGRLSALRRILDLIPTFL